MKIIILAAGKGERLLPLTKNTPKPLLDLGNGSTLLEEQIERIQESGSIEEIVLVIGYLAEQIEAKIKMFINNGIKIRTIYNPFYNVSNNLVSLWLAKPEMDSDFLITNGDNIFAPDVYTDFINKNNNGIFLSVSPKENYDQDDMKVTIENDTVVNVGKTIEADRASAESPGLALVHGSKARELVKDHVEQLVRDESNINKFWLEVFNSMHEKGISIKPWEFDATSKWQEVDLHLDINKVKDLLKIQL